MTEKEKQFLLKDLCARLPYGVMVYEKVREDIDSVVKPMDIGLLAIVSMGISYPIVKPYLRPMSSMIKEEKLEYDKISGQVKTFYGREAESIECSNLIDWLNSHHFDYRGLIEKGLALKAPEEMYKTE